MNAPVVIFAYNRADHIKRLFESLISDSFSADSDIYVFCDGAKNEAAIPKVLAVRECLSDIKNKNMLKSLNLIFREENLGLAKSIITGVSEIVEQYGKVIVIEDDMVLRKDFLKYMNEALDYYETDETVFAVGGYSFAKIPKAYSHDVFYAQRISSYTWATWKSRWNTIDWEVKDYSSFCESKVLQRSFNKWGSDRTDMLKFQMEGRINSWAIRFDYNMWKKNMYTVLPCISRSETTGHDGSGVHFNSVTRGRDSFKASDGNLKRDINFERLSPNEKVRKKYCRPFKKSLFRRFKHTVKQTVNKILKRK